MDCNKTNINRVRKTGVFVCVREREREEDLLKMAQREDRPKG